MKNSDNHSIAMIGGGPAALLLLKNLIEKRVPLSQIYIFESHDRLGVGMPYGKKGSSKEHIANVSAKELPKFDIAFETFMLNTKPKDFPEFSEDGTVNPYKVIPRLLLGDYLEFIFKHYITLAKNRGAKVHVYKNCKVEDIVRDQESDAYNIETTSGSFSTSSVALCTGHHWPTTHEGITEGYYDSPYPPSKFTSVTNFPIAIRGTSLTAVDAVKTLSRINGTYEMQDNGELKYILKDSSPDFRINMFSTGGFLPALRFHSEDDAYSGKWIMTLEEIYDYKKKHGGFIDLDYVFEKSFKTPLHQRDPEFYQRIKHLTMEEFVEEMMSIRKELDSFTLFQAEYKEAAKSIARQQSISWKEALSAFSYAMNYPAKHFSAEDMLRLRKTLMPLISIIIAYLPQSSYKELMALYEAGVIELIQVDKASFVEPHPERGGVYHYQSLGGEDITQHYQLFVDAIGQQPLDLRDLPFKGLREDGLVSAAYLNFKNNDIAQKLAAESEINIHKGFNNNYYMNVHGLEINDHFQSLTNYGEIVDGLYIMAVPFIGGLNPDYSGLDFCDTAGARIADCMMINFENEDQKAEREVV